MSKTKWILQKLILFQFCCRIENFILSSFEVPIAIIEECKALTIAIYWTLLKGRSGLSSVEKFKNNMCPLKLWHKLNLLLWEISYRVFQKGCHKLNGIFTNWTLVNFLFLYLKLKPDAGRFIKIPFWEYSYISNNFQVWFLHNHWFYSYTHSILPQNHKKWKKKFFWLLIWFLLMLMIIWKNIYCQKWEFWPFLNRNSHILFDNWCIL